MGRKTWESLPKKPLPGRLNIIISKTINQEEFKRRHSIPSECSDAEGIKICESLPDAIDCCANYEKIFICGGESIYTQTLPLATKIDLTLIPGDYEGDTWFPEIDENWIKTETVKHDEFSIVTYIRKEE
jgi:dihydrofolate reductase